MPSHDLQDDDLTNWVSLPSRQGVVGIRYVCTIEGVEGVRIIHSGLPGRGGDTHDTGLGNGGKTLEAELHISASSLRSMHIPFAEREHSLA